MEEEKKRALNACGDIQGGLDLSLSLLRKVIPNSRLRVGSHREDAGGLL